MDTLLLDGILADYSPLMHAVPAGHVIESLVGQVIFTVQEPPNSQLFVVYCDLLSVFLDKTWSFFDIHH